MFSTETQRTFKHSYGLHIAVECIVPKYATTFAHFVSLRINEYLQRFFTAFNLLIESDSNKPYVVLKDYDSVTEYATVSKEQMELLHGLATGDSVPTAAKLFAEATRLHLLSTAYIWPRVHSGHIVVSSNLLNGLYFSIGTTTTDSTLHLEQIACERNPNFTAMLKVPDVEAIGHVKRSEPDLDAETVMGYARTLQNAFIARCHRSQQVSDRNVDETAPVHVLTILNPSMETSPDSAFIAIKDEANRFVDAVIVPVLIRRLTIDLNSEVAVNFSTSMQVLASDIQPSE